MHDTHMPTKTISLELDAYEKLAAARTNPKESFSCVVRRAFWPKTGNFGKQILDTINSRKKSNLMLSDEAIEKIEKALSQSIVK